MIIGGFLLVPVNYDTIYRCLPLLAVVVIITTIFRARENRDKAAACALAVFALFSLGRMLLNAGTRQYGFFLAVPSLILFGIFAAALLPRKLRLTLPALAVFSGLVLTLMICQSGKHFISRSMPKFERKTLEISGTHGRMKAFPFRPRYAALQKAVSFLTEHTDPASTLLVIPEGAAVNFLTHRMNPTAYNLFTPPELNAPGVEQRLIEQIFERKVDLILVIDRQVREFGFSAPGVDYALALWPALQENYAIWQRFGPVDPFTSHEKEGGAILLRRKERPVSLGRESGIGK